MSETTALPKRNIRLNHRLRSSKAETSLIFYFKVHQETKQGKSNKITSLQHTRATVPEQEPTPAPAATRTGTAFTTARCEATAHVPTTPHLQKSAQCRILLYFYFFNE